MHMMGDGGGGGENAYPVCVRFARSQVPPLGWGSPIPCPPPQPSPSTPHVGALAAVGGTFGARCAFGVLTAPDHRTGLG